MNIDVNSFKTEILGISASLRNSRKNEDSMLCSELYELKSESDLKKYLKKQGALLTEEFQKAGREDKLPYDEIYKFLLKNKSSDGLSNSEIALAAALWGAKQSGSNISHTALSYYFPARGNSQHLDRLREKILRADAILLSGPVYFGDRGSLANELIEFLRNDPICREHIKNKLYAGISVGAKRNGGQETTLIYQLVDMCNINFLSVGNNSETTSQYGGTVVAGDIGTATDDEYGLNTCIGTGKRIATASQMMKLGQSIEQRKKIKISIWLVQDESEGTGKTLIKKFCEELEGRCDFVQFDIKDFVNEEVRRCIACDICPTHIDKPENYRCIVKSKSDLFVREHENIIHQDGILIAAYSPGNTKNLNSVYQKLIERTRYLRRDDYVLSNILVAPLVFSEINSNQNLHIRMLTSMIRHHTILHHPLLCFEYENKILNWDYVIKQGVNFVNVAQKISTGKLHMDSFKILDNRYNPLGYIFSAAEAETEAYQNKKESILVDKIKRHNIAKELVIAGEKNDAEI